MSVSTLVSQDKMYINGVSSDTVGLYIDTPPMPSFSDLSYSDFSTAGRSESMVLSNKMRENIVLHVNAYTFNYGADVNEIYGFIAGAKTVRFNDDLYEYRVKKVKGIVPTYKNLGKNYLQIQFECSPYRYAVDNSPILTPNERTSSISKVFQTVGNVYSEPKIILRGVAGETTVTVNGVPLHFDATTDGFIYIDIPRMKIYRLNQDEEYETMVMEKTQGAFWNFKFIPSETDYNAVTVQGDILHGIAIYKNERWL